MELADSILQLAFLYAIPAIAVAFSFRVLGFADLTPDGTFTLGAAVAAQCLLLGASFSTSIILALFGGAAAGFLTGLLHTRLGISKLLSGILMMMVLYSVSLRVIGASNVAVGGSAQTLMGRLPSMSGTLVPVIVTGLACLTAWIGAWLLLKTHLGLMLRATGDSEGAFRLRNVALEPRYLIGLAFTNALAAGAGGLIALYQGFADVSMGVGLVIAGLTATIIGETVLRPANVGLLIAAPVLGMIVYQGLVGAALRIGVVPGDLRLLMAVLAIAFVALDRFRSTALPPREIGNRTI